VVGSTQRNPDLAATYRRIANRGTERLEVIEVEVRRAP